MAIRPFKSLLLTSLVLAPLAGCGPEVMETTTEETSALATTQQALSTNGSAYVFVTEVKTWSEAQRHCQDLGPGFNLVTINDSQEELLLEEEQKALNTNRWWIGYNDQASEGQFSWVSGESTNYKNWVPGEPNNFWGNEDCTVDGWDNTGRWNDYDCNNKHAFICERPPRVVTRGNSTYVFVTAVQDWNSAQLHCQNLGPDYNLVTVNNALEEEFLGQVQLQYEKAAWWIGHNDRASEGQFSWVSRSSPTYHNYSPDEPNDRQGNEDCTHDGHLNGLWNDANCADAKYFICEQSPNTPPVVSAGLGTSGNTLSVLELRGSATDADEDTLSLQWTFTPGPGVESWARCTFGAPRSAATTFSCDDDGVYTVTLTAHDGVHPPVSSSTQVTLSSASKVTPCNLPLYTKNPTLKLCGWTTPGSDGGAIVSAWFTLNGGPAIPVVPESSGGFVSTSHTVGEGPHIVRLYAQSSKGNVTMGQRLVNVDLTAPSLTVLSPTAQDVNPSSLVSITSSASDASPVKVTTMRMVSTQLESGSGTVTHTVDLGSTGWTTVLVQAQDMAGNVSEVRTRVYVQP